MPYFSSPASVALSISAFWESISNAWEQVDGGAAVAGLTENTRSLAAARIRELLPEFIAALEGIMAKYTTAQLNAWDEHFKTAVNDLGRARPLSKRERSSLSLDTDQSFHARMALGTGLDDDDAFLKARAFVVATGAKFASAFFNNPAGHPLGFSYAPEMIGLARRVGDRRKEAVDKPDVPEKTRDAQAGGEATDGKSDGAMTPADTPLVTPGKHVVDTYNNNNNSGMLKPLDETFIDDDSKGEAGDGEGW